MAVETSKERNSHSKLTIEKLNDRKIILSVAYLGGGGACDHETPHPPPNVRNFFLTRYTVKNAISNLYILLKSAFKMQEMTFQRHKFQNIYGGRHALGPPRIVSARWPPPH